MALTTPKIFASIIEEIVKEKEITHMEAVLWYCTDQEIEPDSVKGLISKPLKEKIEADGLYQTEYSYYYKLIIW